MTYDLFKDSPAHTLSRVSDPATSKAAGAKTPSGKQRKRMFDAVEGSGERGLTIKEFAHANNVQMSSFSSRPNELFKMGYIFYRSDKRDGCRVMRSVKYRKEENKQDLKFCPKCGLRFLKFYEGKCHGKDCK